MRSTLYLKFIIVYIIFGFLSVFTVATLTFNLTESPLEKKTATSLYREASLIASNYLPSYFDETLDLNAVHHQLSGMEIQLEAAVWFVDKDGVMIAADTGSAESVEKGGGGCRPAFGGNREF